MANFYKQFVICVFLYLLMNEAFCQAPKVLSPAQNSIAYTNNPIIISWKSNTSSNTLIIFYKGLPILEQNVNDNTYIYSPPAPDGQYTITIVDSNSRTSENIHFFKFVAEDLFGKKLWFKADSGLVTAGTFVTKWGNSFSNNNHAVQSIMDRQPFLINSIELLNKYPSISFDGINDFMNFDRINDFKSLFFICKHNSGIQDSPPLLGDSVAFDFHGGSGKNLFDNSFSKMGTSGLRFNSKSQLVNEIIKPVNYSIISIISNDNLKAKYITNDRNASGRFWNGEFAEIIGFSETLPDTMVESIENYLRFKYAPPVYLGHDTTVTTGICPIILGERNRFIKYIWSTGDTTPTISINKTGNYWLKTTDVFGFETSDTIKVTYLEEPILLNDSSFCFGDTVIWNTGLNKSGYYYRWSTGSTDSTIKIFSSSTISLTVLDKTDTVNCRLSYGPIEFTMDPFGTLNAIGNDTTLCENAFLKIHPAIAQQAASYLWSDGTNQPLLTVDTTGRYSLILKNSIGCTLYDSINITVPTGKTSPTISFTGPDTLCMVREYSFSENSVAGSGIIDNYRWIMGESDTAIFKTVNKTYNTPGSYEISLFINTNDGCENQLTKNIEVLDLPSPNFTVPALNCSGNEIPFTDISDSRVYVPLTYKWKFGEPASGASDSSSLLNPTHRYASGGTYNVVYEIIDRHTCRGSINKNITVQNAPAPNFSSTGACAGSFTNITDNTFLPNPLFALSYSWDLGDGTFNSTRGSIQKNYGTPGEKDVKLTVTANNGCSNTITKTIKINAVPQPGFTVSQACAGQNILMTDTSKIMTPDSITGIRWRLSGTEIGTGKNLLYRFNTPGTYTVETIVSTGVCSAGVFKEINVLPGTAAGFDFNPKFGEAPLEVTFNNSSTGAVNYLWIFDDMTTSEQVSPVIVFADEKDYIIKLIATNEAGCSDTATRSLPVRPDNADLTIKNLSLLKNAFGGQPVVEIENIGNVTLTNALINIYDQNEFAGFSKEWTGELAPGQTALINLNINFSTDKDFICATVDLLDGIDKKPENNSRCIIFEKSFKSFYPYPQPVIDGNFTLPLLLPEDAEISVELIDMAGKSILKKPFFLSQGFHKIPIYMPGLHAGIYALVIINGTETEVRKISVQH